MKILKEIKVPTGEIYTAKGDKGVLEFLTVADYGKDANIKADFLGITRELNGVPNGTPMPLTEKMGDNNFYTVRLFNELQVLRRAESRTGTQRNTERPAQRDNNGIRYAPGG